MNLTISKIIGCLPGLLLVACLVVVCDEARSAESENPTNQVASAPVPKALAEVLSPEKRRQVESAVDHALAWIAAQQADDASFPTLPTAQPGVTSLCVMAFLSRGHQPGVGPYGKQLERGIDSAQVRVTNLGSWAAR